MSGEYSMPEREDPYATLNKECDTIERETQCTSNKSCEWDGESKTCNYPLPAPPRPAPYADRSNKPSNYGGKALGGGSRKRRSRKTKAKAKRSGSKRKTRKSTRKAGRKAKRSGSKRSGSKRSGSKRRQTKRS